MALTVVELKQAKKQLEAKKAKMSKVKQVAYDAGVTKTAESLTAQLRDVAQAFCLEVWGQALNVARVSTESELRAFEKVYYPPALHLVPTPPPHQQIPALLSPPPRTGPSPFPLLLRPRAKKKKKKKNYHL